MAPVKQVWRQSKAWERIQFLREQLKNSTRHTASVSFIQCHSLSQSGAPIRALCTVPSCLTILIPFPYFKPNVVHIYFRSLLREHLWPRDWLEPSKLICLFFSLSLTDWIIQHVVTVVCIWPGDNAETVTWSFRFLYNMTNLALMHTNDFFSAANQH